MGTVRRMALGVLSSHPHRNTVARLQEDHLLRSDIVHNDHGVTVALKVFLELVVVVVRMTEDRVGTVRGRHW